MIPQKGKSYEKLTPLDNDGIIATEIEGIYSLFELETAGKLLLASQLRANGKSFGSGENKKEPIKKTRTNERRLRISNVL